MFNKVKAFLAAGTFIRYLLLAPLSCIPLCVLTVVHIAAFASLEYEEDLFPLCTFFS